jgi:hypothetical protein
MPEEDFCAFAPAKGFADSGSPTCREIVRVKAPTAHAGETQPSSNTVRTSIRQCCKYPTGHVPANCPATNAWAQRGAQPQRLALPRIVSCNKKRCIVSSKNKPLLYDLCRLVNLSIITMKLMLHTLVVMLFKTIVAVCGRLQQLDTEHQDCMSFANLGYPNHCVHDYCVAFESVVPLKKKPLSALKS